VGGGGGGRPVAPLDFYIFMYGTNIVDKGLKVLYFGPFLLFFGLFFRWPPLEEAK